MGKKLMVCYFDSEDVIDSNIIRVQLVDSIVIDNSNLINLYEVNDEFLNQKCHCAIDGHDSYLTLRESIDWFNQMIFEGQKRIRVWILKPTELTIPSQSIYDNEDDEEMIFYYGGLPY